MHRIASGGVAGKSPVARLRNFARLGLGFMQSRSLLRFEEEFRLYDHVAERCARRGWSRAARVARRKTMLKLHLGYRALVALLRAQPRRAAGLLGWLYRGGPSVTSRS